MNNYYRHEIVGKKVMLIVAAVLFIAVLYLFFLFKTDAMFDIDTSSLVDDTYIQWTPTLAVEVARNPEVIQEQLGNEVVDSTAGVTVPGTTVVQPPPSSGAIQVTGSDADLANFFRTLGYNDVAIAGIMGNFAAESGMNPAVTQGHKHNAQTLSSCMTNVGGDGHGLAQWDSGRRVALINHANSNGQNWWDLSAQLSYFRLEVEGAEKKNGGVSVMNTCNSVTESCFQFAAKYERCAGATGATLGNPSVIHRWSVRLSNSENYYKWLMTNAG